MSGDTIFLLHLTVTAFLCGLIWVIQLVHYPLFDRVDPGRWSEYGAAHRRRISWVVMPTMVLEGVTAVALLPRPGGESSLDGGPAIANLVLLVGIWLSTAFLQVPAHRRLEDEFDAEAHARLVGTNWIRTALWTMRMVGLAAIAAGAAFSPP